MNERASIEPSNLAIISVLFLNEPASFIVRACFSPEACKRNERGDSNHTIYFEWPNIERRTGCENNYKAKHTRVCVFSVL